MNSRIIQFIFLILLLFVTSNSSVAQSSTDIANTQEVFSEQKNKANPYYSHTATNKLFGVPKKEWKKILSPEVYHIAFEGGTERPYSGKYWDYKGKGTYYCAVCGNELFRSTAKFASICGWPSFFEPSGDRAVQYKEDNSHGLNRIEVVCGRCGAHLGHVFKDGPPPTGLRYCMNSVVLDFLPDKG